VKYVIRSCRTRNELACCVDLQKRIWGYTDLEAYPFRLIVNQGHIGGHAVGAVRKDFEKHFSRRLAVTGFILDRWLGRYLLDSYEN
jgi:predicted GNAT superfamily acetyltransferase